MIERFLHPYVVLASLAWTTSLFPDFALGQSEFNAFGTCTLSEIEVPQEAILASASAISNMWDEKGSVAHESRRMLERAGERLGVVIPAASSCRGECPPLVYARAFFRSTPHRLRVNYFSAKQCNKHLIATRLAPLTFARSGFTTIHDVISWFTDFSQGNQDDGERLYEECPGECSPQYEVLLSKQDGAFSLKANVVCGPARDTSDNQYDLAYGYFVECVPPLTKLSE